MSNKYSYKVAMNMHERSSLFSMNIIKSIPLNILHPFSLVKEAEQG